MIHIKKLVKHISLLSILLLVMSSCGASRSSRAQLYDPKEVKGLSRELGIDLSNTNKDDHKNMALYVEVSQWLGTPYRYGGNTTSGVDCSGFTYQVFQKIYDIEIPRTTARLEKAKQRKVSARNLRAGDLVYFATSNHKRKITHVGIYLKDKYFAHASTSRGVIVSHLDEDYYKKRWVKSGRLR